MKVKTKININEKETADKLDGILFDIPHTSDPKAHDEGYDILEMIEGYENKAREILKAGGYPLTVREILYSRFDKDGMPLEGIKPLPRKIRDAMDVLQHFQVVRIHIKGEARLPDKRTKSERYNDFSFALGFMAYGVDAAARLQIRPLKSFIEIGRKNVDGGKFGGKKSGEVRRDKMKPIENKWQEEANKIWKKHPTWALNRVADNISEKTGESKETIRKKIKKPSL